MGDWRWEAGGRGRGGPRLEVGGRRSEVGAERSEVGGRRSEIRDQSSETEVTIPAPTYLIAQAPTVQIHRRL